MEIVRAGAWGPVRPEAVFVVEELTGSRFVDVSRLLGARLTFDHRVEERDGGTEVRVVVEVEGPLARVWNVILGKGIAASAQRDLEALLAVAARRGVDA